MSRLKNNVNTTSARRPKSTINIPLRQSFTEFAYISNLRPYAKEG
jgi:hypothetical protein